MALKYISSTISETDGHVFYDNHDLDRVIWVDPQEGSHVVWERQQPSEWKGLRILPTGDNMVSVRLVVNGTPGTINPIYYSGDQGVTWNELTTTDSAEYSEIWLKSYNPTGLGAKVTEWSSQYNLQSWRSIVCTGESYCTGNITSLLDNTGNLTDLTECNDYCLAGVFNNDSNNLIGFDCFYPIILSAGCYFNCLPITTVYVSALPATTLAVRCYMKMFRNCTELEYAPYLNANDLVESCYQQMFLHCHSLIDSPILPAMNLANSCYYGMFQGCRSLTTAPTLPATTLAHNCYGYMFTGCWALTNPPTLIAMNLATDCYAGMFEECTSLVNAPALPATTLADACYSYMFTECTSLTNPPALNARNLAELCYMCMFINCSSLVTAPDLPATTLTNYCYSNMFSGCTSLVYTPRLPATTLASYCYKNMFNGCTSLEVAPILPAEILVSSCYYEMFRGCSSLNRIICSATDRSATDATNNWCLGVPEVGDFYCPSIVSPQWVEWGPSDIPYQWTRHSTDKVIIYGYSEHGTVEGSGTYDVGVGVTLTFTPAHGYVFDHWEYVDGTVASRDNPYTFASSENLILKAVTEYARYTLNAGALNGVVAATVGGVGVQLPYTGAYGTEIRLTVNAIQGFEFWFWDDGSTDNPYDVTLTDNIDLYAVCASTDMEYLYFLSESQFNCSISASTSSNPIVEYSTYNIETQSWNEWIELTWSEGKHTGIENVQYVRLRGSNHESAQGIRFTFNSNKVKAAGTPNALLYNGVAVRTLDIPYCFANMFREPGYEAYTSRAYSPCEYSRNFLPATVLCEHCYDGMFSKGDDLGGTTVWKGPRLFLPDASYRISSYSNLCSLRSTDYRSYSFGIEIYYYGNSALESVVAQSMFYGCRSGVLHIRQGLRPPEIGHGVIVIQDLA